jgi:hypothetical protein
VNTNPQFAHQHVDRGFQLPDLIHPPTATATATVAQACGCGKYRGRENRCQR